MWLEAWLIPQDSAVAHNVLGTQYLHPYLEWLIPEVLGKGIRSGPLPWACAHSLSIHITRGEVSGVLPHDSH